MPRRKSSVGEGPGAPGSPSRGGGASSPRVGTLAHDPTNAALLSELGHGLGSVRHSKRILSSPTRRPIDVERPIPILRLDEGAALAAARAWPGGDGPDEHELLALSLESSGGTEVAGGLVVGSDPALFDSGPAGDPLIGSIDELLQVGVGHDPFRHVTTGAEDDCRRGGRIGIRHWMERISGSPQ